MTDFRALCSELHAAFNTYAVNEPHHDLLVRAAAALAQPASQGPWPTDEELYDLWNQEGPEADFQECRRFARAVLARWGNYQVSLISSTQPLPEGNHPQSTGTTQ